MYDKTVRRRRAVLGLLVASSLILLTAYFGESAGTGLHAVQRGVLEVVSPIQEGASRALKPVRDLFGWIGDTFNAKGEVKGLRRDRDAWRREAIDGQVAVRQNAQLKRQLKLDEALGLGGAGAVMARVTGQDPSLWFNQIEINKGSADGLRVAQPVITGEGLIGRVTFVSRTSAIVTLITDHTTSVGAQVSQSGVRGVVQVEAGRPDDLVMQFTGRNDVVDPGQTIVTSGTLSKTGGLPSLYPPNIPIGRVTRVDDPASDDQQVHLRPFADMRRLELVQVLTKTAGASGP